MDESGIVASVETFGGNENESTKLKELLQEDKEKGIKSEALTADGLYDSANARAGNQEWSNASLYPFHR